MALYGSLTEAAAAALREAIFSRMPVVKVGRGRNDGLTTQAPSFLSGNNLTASSARLRMARLMNLAYQAHAPEDLL